jgi:hypothetical protein
LTSQGQSVPDAIRSIGVSEVTYYRWRQEYGGLKSDQAKRLKDLETEKGRLRRTISDLTLSDPARGCQGKLLSPARRRACISMCNVSFTYPSAGERLTADIIKLVRHAEAVITIAHEDSRS